LKAPIVRRRKVLADIVRLKSVKIAYFDGIQNPCFIGRSVRLNKFTLRDSVSEAIHGKPAYPPQRAQQGKRQPDYEHSQSDVRDQQESVHAKR
jgi:hypothetical protein